MNFHLEEDVVIDVIATSYFLLGLAVLSAYPQMRLSNTSQKARLHFLKLGKFKVVIYQKWVWFCLSMQKLIV